MHEETGEITLAQLLASSPAPTLSARVLEETIHTERARQDQQVGQLNTLRERNASLQGALTQEVARLGEMTDRLREQRERAPSAWQALLARLPWRRQGALNTQSVEALLRAQYEQSALRVKEAADYADRLDVARADLYDEIERLHQKIIDYAREEQTTRQRVVALSSFKAKLELRLAQAERGVGQRELQAELDRARRALAEDAARLRLCDTAEERLVRLQDNTRLLAQTIGQLQSDILTYVTVASEQLDLVAGQIQAIGAAADAALVVMELRQSLSAMTEALNHTTRFVSQTQAYFHQDVDAMVRDLSLYDEETERTLHQNLALSESMDDEAISVAIEVAVARSAQRRG